jgi:hypothetical protein
MQEAVKEDSLLHDVTWHIFRHTYISRLVMAGRRSEDSTGTRWV